MKSGVKILAHWVLAMVLVGQALAAVAAPCGIASEAPVAGQAPASVGDMHAGHHMPDSGASVDHAEHGEPSSAAACCDGGYCSSNGCFSVPAVSSTGVETGLSWHAVIHAPATYNFESRVRLALFRPPAAA